MWSDVWLFIIINYIMSESHSHINRHVGDVSSRWPTSLSTWSTELVVRTTNLHLFFLRRVNGKGDIVEITDSPPLRVTSVAAWLCMWLGFGISPSWTTKPCRESLKLFIMSPVLKYHPCRTSTSREEHEGSWKNEQRTQTQQAADSFHCWSKSTSNVLLNSGSLLTYNLNMNINV